MSKRSTFKRRPPGPNARGRTYRQWNRGKGKGTQRAMLREGLKMAALPKIQERMNPSRQHIRRTAWKVAKAEGRRLIDREALSAHRTGTRG